MAVARTPFLHRLLPGVLATAIAAGCSPSPEDPVGTATPGVTGTSGQTGGSGDPCQRAGSLCRPLLQTTAAKCAGAQQTRAALGYPDAIGPGPVYPGPYPIHGSERPSRATKDTPFSAAPVHQDGNGERLPDGPWHGNKLLWWVSADYLGPVLIRAFAVGHDGRARIQRDGFAAASYIPAPPPGSEPIAERNAFGYSSGMWVSEPGCYAWQIDGQDSSYLIYFNAVLE